MKMKIILIFILSLFVAACGSDQLDNRYNKKEIIASAYESVTNSNEDAQSNVNAFVTTRFEYISNDRYPIDFEKSVNKVSLEIFDTESIKENKITKYNVNIGIDFNGKSTGGRIERIEVPLKKYERIIQYAKSPNQ